MCKIRFLALIAVAMLRGSVLLAQPLPATFGLDAHVLSANKAKLKAGNAALQPAYQQLQQDAAEALAFGPVSVMEKKHVPPSGDKHDYMSLAPYHWPDPSKPDGLPYMRKDGQTNPEVREYKDKEYLPKLCESVYALSLAYYFSDDQKYAEHASRLLRVWFLDEATRMNPNLNFGQAIKGVVTGRGAGLIDTRHLVKVVDAIGLLQGSASWKAADQAGMEKWFADFLHWMQTSKNGMDEMNAVNNHGVWYDTQRLSFALFTRNQELAKKILANLQRRIDSQMDNNGFFPAELARTMSLHYSAFVLEPFFVSAEMAKHIPADLWNYRSSSGKSLQKAFHALEPYLVLEKKWEGQQIREFDFRETIPLIMKASSHFACPACAEAVNKIAGKDAPKLRMHLLTNSNS